MYRQPFLTYCDHFLSNEEMECIVAVISSLFSKVSEDMADGAAAFLVGLSHAYNRRVFLTREGHLGIGPTIMQHGGEVVVLFGGRMPCVVRRWPDHHKFIGDCYVRDDDIMNGRITEAVRHGRGGPPVFTFELR